MIHLYNEAQIRWQISYDNPKLDYLVLEVENGINVYFYYHTEEIERVSKVWR